MPSKKAPAQAPVLQLKITLEGSEPPIWRRVLVPATVSLLRLHRILQIVMGWESRHLHMFELEGKEYSDPWQDDEQQFEDGQKAILGQVTTPKTKEFFYVYDFGDGWRHHIEIENILPPQNTAPYPLCVAGARACPPEDVGGIGGYGEFLNAIRDPNHESHEDYLSWIGGFFDPLGFDANAVHRRFKAFRSNRSKSIRRA